jgi:hypothetical protein
MRPVPDIDRIPSAIRCRCLRFSGVRAIVIFDSPPIMKYWHP